MTQSPESSCNVAPVSGRKMVAMGLEFLIYHRKFFIQLSTSQEHEDCWHPTCWWASGNEPPPWILSHALDSSLKKWKRCTLDCSIIWREVARKCGRRTHGPVGPDLNTLQVNSRHCVWEWSSPRAGCTLLVNTCPHGLIGCRVPCNQGCEPRRK